MPPKKKKRTIRCSICNVFGHLTAECDDTANPVVANPESTPATLPTAHVPESPPPKRLKRGLPDFASRSVPVTAADDRVPGQRATPRTSLHPGAGCLFREVDASSADPAGPSRSASADLPLSPLPKRLKRSRPNFASVSVPVTAADDRVPGQRATPRTSLHPGAGSSFREVGASSADPAGPSRSASADLPLKREKRTKHSAMTRLQAENLIDENEPQQEGLAWTRQILLQEIHAVRQNSFLHTCRVDSATESSTSSDEETLNASHEDDHCACCHRCVTEDFLLHLAQVNIITRRSYGDRDAPNVALLCTECAAYLGTRDRTPKWVHAWPAVLFSFLTSETLSFDPKKLAQILPQTIKDSYKRLVPRMSAAISAVWESPCLSIDGTEKLKNFKTDLLKHAGILASKLNASCFPSVKCPMGCNTYLDGDVGRDVDYLPLSNYLAFICPQFTSFKANSNFFRGARPDWPSRGDYEGFEYAATVMVDSHQGLVVVTCSRKMHADGKSLYIHVPTHPVLGSTSELLPDIVAPVSANPHFVRAGRSNEFSSSYAVYREYGDASGASSFSLTPKPHLQGPCNERQIESLGLALNQRPEIFQSLLEAKTLPAELFRDLKQSYESEPLNDDIIDECKSSGSYVDFNDASHMLMNFNQRLTIGPNDERHQDLRAKGKEYLQLVHPDNKVGQMPFKMPHLSKANGPNHNGLVLHYVVTTLLHNRHLHHLFLEKLGTEVHGSVHHKVQATITAVAGGLRIKKPLELEEQLVRIALEKSWCRANSGTIKVSHAILANFCGVRTVNLVCNLQKLERIAERSQKVLLVDCSAVNASEAPISLCNGRWQLMMAHKHFFDHRNLYKMYSDFRWTTQLKWHHCLSGTSLPSEFGDRPRRLLWNTLVYVESDSVESVCKTEFLNFTGGQTKLKCAEHRTHFLMKERPGSRLVCCTVDCQSPVRYRCGKGFGCRVMLCRAGLCLKHANIVLKSDAGTTYIDPPLNNAPLLATNEDDNEEEDAAAGIHILHDDPPLIPEELDDVAEMYATPLDTLATQLPVATEYLQPTYSTNDKSTSGHFLLNKCLNMMSRVEINRKAPVSFQNIVTHIHSISPEQSIPLLYPEGLLFPTIFWAAVDRSVVGALPSVFYSSFGRKSVYGGFASLVDHLRVRLFDSSLLTSHDPNYLAFCFDTYLNSLLQSNSVAIALRKGLEHVNRAFVLPENRENSLKFDEADSRREVLCLSAMIAENPWDFFITLTCNDSETFGVAPIRRALEKKYRGQELDKKFQNACPLLCRAWARTIHYLFEFLMHGEEKIFGDLKNAWYRFEFQNCGSPGNKPHVHAGLTLKDRSRNDTERLKKVHNNLLAMFNKGNRTDEESLIKDGLVEDHGDFVKVFKLADRLTQHKCANSQFKCMKITSKDGRKRCRVPRYLNSALPRYFEHTQMYNFETQERLLKLGLGQRRYPPEFDHLSELDNYVVIEPTLLGGRYNYEGEPSVCRVPSNGRLFALLRSMVNVQICDVKFSSSYLAKYAAGADEKREVVITTTGKDATKVDVEPRDLYHSKISGAKIAHDEKLRAEKSKEALCREITATEMVWFTHQLPFVVCTADFVNCSTHAPEHRQVVYRQRGGYIQKLINEDGSLKAMTLRAHLPFWRHFTESQTILISEIVNSPYVVDNTSCFSVRPPELLLVSRLGDYLKWFSFSSANAITVADEVSECPWIDGSGKRVRVRKRYLDKVRRFFQRLANRLPVISGALEMHGLLEALDHEVVQGSDSAFVNRFVDISAENDVVVVFTCIEPSCMSKFLVHLVLTFGSYETELDLFRGPTLLHAFQYAGLIADAETPTEEEALAIIRVYVMKQLRSLPYGANGFSWLLALAMDGLLTFFRTRGVEYTEVPLASLRAIREDATEKLHRLEALRTQTLGSVLATSGITNSPTAAVLSSMRKFDFLPEIERLPEQSRSSYAEQLQCLRALVAAINSFERAGPVFVPCPLIVGPPGAGKTHLLLTGCIYALSRGLRTIITAATAERARSLGGEHLHLLFALPTVKQVTESVPVTAQKCLLNLSASPLKMAYLKRLDVLVVEEIGLLPASLLNIIDFVLRRLRDSTVPFGGVLLLCCGDPCQLKPVRGRSIWLMPNLCTMFNVLVLKHLVRSRGDPELQTLIKLIRKTTLDVHDVQESIAIVRNRCAPRQFVKSWEEVPDRYQRVVGKNSAVEYAINIYLKQKKATPGLHYILQHAHDEIEVIGGSWMPASVAVSRQLSRECKEPFELLLYCRQVLRLSFNNSSQTGAIPKFSQGQLCVILQLPDLSLPRSAQRTTIKLVPPGVRVISVDALPDEWPVFAIARRFTIPQMIRVHMSKAKREQWPFAYHVCTTVHRCIGETLPKLATQISEHASMFHLWDKNQLLVILSRVQSLDDLLFVGDIGDTLRAMEKLLRVVDPWEVFIDKILIACDTIRNGDGLLPRNVSSSYPTILSSLPSTDSGFTYLMVSMRYDSFCIDYGHSLRRALKQFNDPEIRSETRSRRPWVLACFITGFSNNADETAMSDFAASWRAQIQQRHGPNAKSYQALEIGRTLFREEKLNEEDLKIQECLVLREMAANH